jgi:hypothetical protein
LPATKRQKETKPQHRHLLGNKRAVGNKGGRPGLYEQEKHCSLVYRLALLQATDKEMADALEIELSTFERWKLEHPEFKESIREGGVRADAKAAERLFNRACGYEREAVKIFQYEGQPVIVPYQEHIPADTKAAHLWLMNRQRKNDRWNAGVAGAPIGTAENPMHHLVATASVGSTQLTPAITAAIEQLAIARLEATEPEVEYTEGESGNDQS